MQQHHSVSLEEARRHPREQARIADLMRHVPVGLERALDIGARDGYLSLQLLEVVQQVTALDLEIPPVRHERLTPVRGNATKLDYPAETFDLVLCAEVLEHIPPAELPLACSEIVRVSRRYVLIGVPFHQDTRVGRATCAACGTRNPPWGHVNSFDRARLQRLFLPMRPVGVTFVGSHKERTNALSALLNDWAGNPWGTYDQDEPCIGCGAKLVRPSRRSFSSRIASKVAFLINRVQQPFIAEQANWVHVLFER